jgi:hydrogenase maturation protease
MKTIVLGVGNPILRDDGVGIHVANTIEKELYNSNVKIDVAFTGGMNLLDLIRGHDQAILIDAMIMKNKKIGEVGLFDINNFNTFHTSNPHDVSLSEAINLAKKLGDNNIPKEIKIVGINIGKFSYEFGENLSCEVEKAIPKAVDIVKKEVKKYE